MTIPCNVGVSLVSLLIVFNAKKCMLMCVGKHYTAARISVFIDNVALTKVTLFKYLGVSFVADRELNVDVSYMQHTV